MRKLNIILTAIFALSALNAWAEVVRVALGHSDNPPSLIALQIGVGLTGVAAAWGSWRRTRWAAGVAVAHGAITAGLLAALPSLLLLPTEARPGLWISSGAVMLFALFGAAYLRSDAQRHAERISTERANET